MGARANGMANASSCLYDVWALTGNVAGLAKVDRPSIACSYHAIPSAKFFNRLAAVFALPLKTGVAAASAFRFGDDLYQEQSLSLGYANTFGLASLGLKVNYLQYRAAGVGTHAVFTASFGGIARLTPRLSFGAHIVNINQPIIHALTGERIPTRLITGVAFQPSEKLIATGEIEKEPGHPPTWKSAVEYQVFEKITFRTGYNLHPEAAFFGLGFTFRKFDLGYALQWNDPFGLSHQATVTFEFGNP